MSDFELKPVYKSIKTEKSRNPKWLIFVKSGVFLKPLAKGFKEKHPGMLYWYISLSSRIKSLIIIAGVCMMMGEKLEAQTSLVDSLANVPVIMEHYNYSDLQQMDTTKLRTILYYYTASFTVTPVSCIDCVAFDSTLFDVSLYENVRQYHEVYTRTYDKYGFTLTLVPVDQLRYKLPIHSKFYTIPASTAEPRQN